MLIPWLMLNNVCRVVFTDRSSNSERRYNKKNQHKNSTTENSCGGNNALKCARARDSNLNRDTTLHSIAWIWVFDIVQLTCQCSHIWDANACTASIVRHTRDIQIGTRLVIVQRVGFHCKPLSSICNKKGVYFRTNWGSIIWRSARLCWHRDRDSDSINLFVWVSEQQWATCDLVLVNNHTGEFNTPTSLQ